MTAQASLPLDPLETRDPEERERSQFECLAAQLSTAVKTTPALAEQLGEAEPTEIDDRAALAALPVMRKADLAARQKADPPFGGLAARPAQEFEHVFQSPGPIYEPGMSSVPDWWRCARALRAAGITRDDVVHNSFSYHLTPAGVMLESGARALGCVVFPGGVGNSEAQASAAADLAATAYVGTPDFLKILIEKAEELGRTLAFTKAWVSGGPLFPSLRASYEDRGIATLQGYATA
ncbi:MAG: phenylacetate--CoA ligase family protein, partial [Pseudomonadota bacterium]